jgi:2-methylcitrate dehydratase
MEDDVKKNDDVRPRVPALGRRDLMKLGAGVVLTTLNAPNALAQNQEQGRGRGRGSQPAERPEGFNLATRVGYKNEANRVSGNGPMDHTSRQLASYVNSFSESQLTEPVVVGLNKLMLDCTVALIGSFGSEVGQITARLARLYPAGDLKSTVAGYGITTVPEAAAFANSFMVRNADYNDGDGENGGHVSVIIPGILAIGEAVHATGPQVLAAVAVGYEVLSSFAHFARGGGGGWDAPYEGLATALACGKLLGLNEDRLANACSLALVPHMPLNVSHVGALSHWKSGHSPIGVRNGVFAALMAREGMTGPAQPFEERGGLMDVVTGPFELRLPVVDGKMNVETFRVKRFPAEGGTQAILHQALPPIKEWTKAEDIESIRVEITSLGEIADPPKWDPRNRETADHSLPYLIAVALTDGEVYLDAFKPERYLHDEKLRQLMARTTIQANPTLVGTQGKSRITVRKKTGETMTKVVEKEVPVTYDEVLKKFDRVCAYQSVPNDQRDRARATWTNLRGVKDIAEPMRAFAKFGPALPLTGGTPRS